jgi:hypothetical protein
MSYETKNLLDEDIDKLFGIEENYFNDFKSGPPLQVVVSKSRPYKGPLILANV